MDLSKAQEFTAYIPTEGLFRSSTDFGSTIYQRSGNQIKQFDVASILSPEERVGAQNQGDLVARALPKLKEMGIDWNSLQGYNIGDVNQSAGREGIQMVSRAGPEGGQDNYIGQGGSLTSLIQQKPLASTGSTAFRLNTPQDVATAQKQLTEAQARPQAQTTPQQQVQPTGQTAGQVIQPTPPGQPTPQGGQPIPTAPITPAQTPVSTYTGPSIVDYLASVGKPSDFNSRKVLAQSLGIQNYRGTAQENTQMLDTLRKQAPSVATPVATTAPTAPTTTTAPTAPQVTKMGTPLPTTPATFTETYKQALENSGVSSIKKAFDDTQNKYDDLQNKLNDEITLVGENPWISEGLRSKKISALQSKYEGKLGILTNKLKLYDSLHQQAQIEAKFLASGEQDQSQFDTNTQMKLFELAQKEAEAKAKLLEIDPSNYKEVQGGLVDVRTGTWVIPPSASGG